jgi:hypothetical protein
MSRIDDKKSSLHEFGERKIKSLVDRHKGACYNFAIEEKVYIGLEKSTPRLLRGGRNCVSRKISGFPGGPLL